MNKKEKLLVIICSILLSCVVVSTIGVYQAHYKESLKQNHIH